MPVATPDQYAQMLDTAKAKGFAFPAVNVSSSATINAVLQGLSEAAADAGAAARNEDDVAAGIHKRRRL